MVKDTEAVNPTPQIDDLPDQSVSEAPAGQPLDQASGSPATLEDLRAMVREEMQSVKDTRIGKSETRLDSVESTLAQYEAEKGGTVDAKALATLQGVQREKELLERVMALEGGNVVATSAGAGEKSWGEKQQAILENVGIDASDVRVVELLRSASSKQEFLAELEAKSFDWKQADENKPKPSASTVAQVVPSVPASGGDYTTEKYVEDMIAARGNKGKLDAIRAKATADGLDIDRISINV